MKIAIKYPRKKFIEANDIRELQDELKILMVEVFDIKDSSNKPFIEIKLNVNASKISSSDFKILQQNNAVIVPTIITQCKI